jgi:hypothetical protein
MRTPLPSPEPSDDDIHWFDWICPQCGQCPGALDWDEFRPGARYQCGECGGHSTGEYILWSMAKLRGRRR